MTTAATSSATRVLSDKNHAGPLRPWLRCKLAPWCILVSVAVTPRRRGSTRRALRAQRTDLRVLEQSSAGIRERRARHRRRGERWGGARLLCCFLCGGGEFLAAGGGFLFLFFCFVPVCHCYPLFCFF